MPIVDNVMNLYHKRQYERSKDTLSLHYELAEELQEAHKHGKATEIFEKVTRHYVYRLDPLGGALNWNYRSLEAIASTKFKGDCDKFASLAQMAYPGRNRIAIIPKNIFKIAKSHVIYSNWIAIPMFYQGYSMRPYVFSSGNILQTTLDNYIESRYNREDVFIIELPDGY